MIKLVQRFGWMAVFILTGGIGLYLICPQALDSRANPQNPAQKTLQYEVSVTLKLVQVYVMDKNGHPVPDLTANDFELTDNGQAMPVSHFEKHVLAGPEEVPATPVPVPRINRKFFFFFDLAFINPPGVLNAKNAGLHFMDTELQPTDEVGLISYSASRGLTVHEYLTTDHRRVREIIGGFGLRHIAGRAENLSNFIYNQDLSEPEPPMPGSRGRQPPSQEEDFFSKLARQQTAQQIELGRRQAYGDQARRFIITLNQLAKVLRYVPGYKNIIFFSTGIARQLLYGKKGESPTVGEWATPDELAAELKAYDDAQADSGLRDDFTGALKELRASNCPVYAVDMSQVQQDVDVINPEGMSLSSRHLVGEDSLRQLAGDTGGKYYGTTLDYKKSMDNIQTITSSYYVLGYSVNEKWDGKFHKIKVKVKRKECEVLAQGGYFSPKPYAEYSRFEKLIHLIDLALSENPQLQLPGEVPLVAMPVMVGGWMQLAAFARVPRDLTADVLGEHSEACLLILDVKGNIISIKRIRLVVPAREKDVLYPVFVVPIKPGQYSCRLVLRNMETGRGARGASSLTVSESGIAPVWLDPPLLLMPESKATDIGASSGALLSSLFAYDKDSYAPLVGDLPAGLTKLYAALRCTMGGARREIELAASLVNSQTSVRSDVPISIMKQAQDGQTQLLFVELALGEVKPGSYNLFIIAKQKGGQESAYKTAKITVK